MATWGRTTAGASKDNTGTPRQRRDASAFPENGTLTSISGWMDNINPTTQQCIFVLYDGSNNVVAITEQYAGAITGSTTTLITLNILSGTTALVSGNNYRIGVWGENNASRICFDAGGSGAYANSAGTYPTPDDPFVDGGTFARDYSLYLNYTPAVVGPAITSTTDPAITGAGLLTIGTGFGATQGSGGVTQEQGAVVVGLNETFWSDTLIGADSATIESTGLKYGTQTLRVTDDSAATATVTFIANPTSGNSYVDLTSVATVGQIITAAPLAIGDQLRYANVTDQGGYAVVVSADATFTIAGAAPDGVYTFAVRAWDTSDQTWGTVATQTVTLGTPPVGGGSAHIGIRIGIGIY